MNDQPSTRDRIEKAINEMHEAGCDMTISAVAREAGTSNASIHNRYPDLAVRIRELAGKAAERDVKQVLTKRTGRIKKLEDKLSCKNAELTELNEQLAKARSLNIKLELENKANLEEINSLKKRLGLVIPGGFSSV